jgi:hypothetical protein
VVTYAKGQENTLLAAMCRISEQMVGAWRARFVEFQLEGPLDAPRSGAPGAMRMVFSMSQVGGLSKGPTAGSIYK